MNSYINIFTDGSSLGNPGPSGWGAVIHYVNYEDKKMTDFDFHLGPKEVDLKVEIGGNHPKSTNNRMELQAIIESLKFILMNDTYKVNDEIIIHTDSKMTQESIKSWLKSWIKNDWRKSNNKEVMNSDLWKEYVSISEFFSNLDVKWVKAHKKSVNYESIMNNTADSIAVKHANLIK